MHFLPLVDTERIAFRHNIERVILILMKKNQTKIYLALAPLLGGLGGPLPGQGARSA